MRQQQSETLRGLGGSNLPFFVSKTTTLRDVHHADDKRRRTGIVDGQLCFKAESGSKCNRPHKPPIK